MEAVSTAPTSEPPVPQQEQPPVAAEAAAVTTRPTPTAILSSKLLGELEKLMSADGADAIVLMYSWHCCARCILRMLSVRVIELYKQTDLYIQFYLRDWVAKFDKSLPLIMHTNVNDRPEICPLCFGILPHMDRPETSDDLISQITKSGYQIEDYGLRVRICTALSIRHYRFWFQLQQAFPNAKMFAKGPLHDSIVELKEALRWVISTLTLRKLRIEHKHKSRFEILFEITHEETSSEYKLIWPNLVDAGSDAEGDGAADEEKEPEKPVSARKRKRMESQKAPSIDGISTVKAKLRMTKKDEMLSLAPEVPAAVSTLGQFKLEFSHLPIFVAGRYIKMTRTFSQTPWGIKGTEQRIGQFSVSECMTDILVPIFKCDECKFSSAGREDLDVRMLGRGRPFMLEFINPRQSRFSKYQYAEFQKKINALRPESVQVRDLQFVPPHATNVIKTSQDTKIKRYQCVVWTPDTLNPEEVSQKLSNLGEIVLQQWTPVRVLHRRALALRERKIHHLTFEIVDSNHLKLDLATQAGTYIKEFVHGDLGRTRPNITEILGLSCADLLALDVTDVEVDWPPVTDATFNPAASAPSIMLGLPTPGVRSLIVTEEDELCE